MTGAQDLRRGAPAPTADPAPLLGWFSRAAHVTVAFSGGVDSALVLAAATRALGAGKVHAVTAVSPSLPAGMLGAARQLAAGLGVRHTEMPTAEMDEPGYRANGADRCYFCKSALLDALLALDGIADRGTVVTGTNADDTQAGWRPGIRAAAERGAQTPLADVGLSKQQVREISRSWQLPTWDRPASPCLSSRVAYGIQITPARLARVDEAEQAVRRALEASGISVHDLRVRDLGDSARVEVDAGIVADVQGCPGVRAAIAAAGFGLAGVEVRAFRSGALNAALPAELRFA
jgi:pyridinium-3,5-biscarboxylic acid mononucleotide sulfurtransferase